MACWLTGSNIQSAVDRLGEFSLSWRRTLNRPASRSPDTDFVPECLIQLSTNICVPACASILSPIVAKSQASMWHAFLRRCMRIHSFYGYQERFSAHFCISSARLLQNRCFETMLSLETTPHGGTIVYYLFFAQLTHNYTFHYLPPFPSIDVRGSAIRFQELSRELPRASIFSRGKRKMTIGLRMAIVLFRLYRTS